MAPNRVSGADLKSASTYPLSRLMFGRAASTADAEPGVDAEITAASMKNVDRRENWCKISLPLAMIVPRCF